MSSILLIPACIRNRRPATTTLEVVYRDDGHNGLPLLSLFRGGWSTRKADYRGRDIYHVEEINTGMDGRAFLLHREPEAITKSDDDTDRYGVLIARNGQDDVCECRGFEAQGRCKHATALRGLIEAGHMDRPGQDAPVTIFPTPEQVEHDAMRPDSLPEGVDPFGFCAPEPDADLYIGASYKPGHDSDFAF